MIQQIMKNKNIENLILLKFLKIKQMNDINNKLLRRKKEGDKN